MRTLIAVLLALALLAGLATTASAARNAVYVTDSIVCDYGTGDPVEWKPVELETDTFGTSSYVYVWLKAPVSGDPTTFVWSLKSKGAAVQSGELLYAWFPCGDWGPYYVFVGDTGVELNTSDLALSGKGKERFTLEVDFVEGGSYGSDSFVVSTSPEPSKKN